MILFGFYSTHFKVNIHLPFINTHRRTTVPFNITPIISYGDLRTTGMYKALADCCEGYRNSDIICLLQPSQKIHYCNQSVLVIVPDLKISAFIITISDLISRSALVWFSLLRTSYLYNSMGLRLYIFGSLPVYCLCNLHCHS